MTVWLFTNPLLAGAVAVMAGAVVSKVTLLVPLLPMLPAESVQLTYQ